VLSDATLNESSTDVSAGVSRLAAVRGWTLKL